MVSILAVPEPVLNYCGLCVRRVDRLCAYSQLHTTEPPATVHWGCMQTSAYPEIQRRIPISGVRGQAACGGCALIGRCDNHDTATDTEDPGTGREFWDCRVAPPTGLVGEPNWTFRAPAQWAGTDMAECALCGHEDREELMVLVDAQDQAYWLCQTHAQTRVHECACCGETLVKGLSPVQSACGDWVCPSCLEDRYVTCDECSDYVHEDFVCYRDGGHLCQSCADNYDENEDDDCECDDGVIAEYHSRSKTRVKFGTKTPELPYRRGCEWEIEMGNNSDRQGDARHILEMMDENFLYLERDGSLDSGFEIVTAPHTKAYFEENEVRLRAMFAYLSEHGWRSHNTSTCGFHIHVGREAFGDWGEENEGNLAKLLLIMERFWTPMVRLSRRTNSNLNQWAGRYDTVDPEKIKDISKSQGGYGRYKAINLCRCDTVEFRMFRGTLNFETICATLDLVDALIATARDESTARIYGARKLSALIGKKRMTPAMKAYFAIRGVE